MGERKERVHRLEFLLAAQEEIVEVGLDLGRITDVVCRRTLELLGADGTTVELRDGDDMVYRAAAGRAAAHLGLRIPVRGSLSGAATTTGAILRSDDTERDSRVNLEACRAVGARSMVIVPLLHAGELAGALKVYSSRPGSFDDEDVHLLELISGLIGSAMANATAHARAEARVDQLHHVATHDLLTGLPNRARLYEAIRDLIAVKNRESRPAAVLMLDLDGFKGVNDSLGHAAGDEVLRAIADRFRDRLRTGDVVARVGGDEFAVLPALAENDESAARAAERLRQAAADPVTTAHGEVMVGVSAGHALFPRDGADAESLLEAADQRMYEDKTARRAAR